MCRTDTIVRRSSQISEITMKMTIFLFGVTYTDKLFAVRPGTWIEKAHLFHVEIKGCSIQKLFSFVMLRSQTKLWKTFNANTWHVKMTSLASCQDSVLDDDRVFPRLFNTDSRRTEVSQSWEKMPNPRVQESGAHHHFGFSKDNNELQGCALCFYFMMLICEHLKLYVTINCITNISHCDIWQWNTMQQVGGSTRDPDGVYIPSINLPSTD